MDSNTTTYTKTFSIDLERTNYHLKMKKRKIKRIIIVIFIWIILIAYFICPLSKINLKVSGNVYFTKNELMNLAYINKNEFWWLFNKNNAIKVLEANDYIENVEIHKSPFGVKMKISEIYPIGKIENSFVFSDGSINDKFDYPFNEKIINITDFSSINSNKINDVSYKYKQVPKYIRDNIESIKVETTSFDYNFILLDGYDEKIGYFTIKTDLVYLDTKFNGNKYSKIIEEISKNNIKYSNENRALIAYLYPEEEKFDLVDSFEGD